MRWGAERRCPGFWFEHPGEQGHRSLANHQEWERDAELRLEVERKAPPDTQAAVPRRHRRREPEMALWQELWVFPPGHVGRKGQRAGVQAAARQLHER